MKLLLQIFLLFLTWFTNLNETPLFTKVALPTYEFSFSKIENVKEESDIKIGAQNFARSSIEEQQVQTTIFHQNTFLLSSYLKGENSCVLDFQKTAFLYQVTLVQFSKKEQLSLLENRARVRSLKVVTGAGNILNKVVLGSEDLSQFAVNFRKTLAIPNHKGNVAVFEYLDNSGNLVKKAFTTAESGPLKGIHSERIADEFFVTNNIPKSNIKRVYSELEPCELASKCKELLQTEYKQATIIYSYSYPGGIDNTIRINSVNQRFLDLENLLK